MSSISGFDHGPFFSEELPKEKSPKQKKEKRIRVEESLPTKQESHKKVKAKKAPSTDAMSERMQKAAKNVIPNKRDLKRPREEEDEGEEAIKRDVHFSPPSDDPVVLEALRYIPEAQRKDVYESVVILFKDISEFYKEIIIEAIKELDPELRVDVINRAAPFWVDGSSAEDRANILKMFGRKEKAKDVFEVFNKGYADAVKSFLKEEKKLAATGGEKSVKQALVFSPQRKTLQTSVAQKVLSELLVDFDRYNISEEDGKYYLRKGKAYMRYPTTHGVPGDKIELQEFLKNVNFNHINFTDAEVNAYTTLIESAMYDGSRPLPPTQYDEDGNSRIGYPKSGPCSELLEGEKMAINIYTGDENTFMIRLMQGRIKDALIRAGKGTSSRLKSLLLSSAMTVAALNKLPDYDPLAKKDGKKQQFLFRYEGTLRDDVMKARLEAVAKGGGVTTELGFLSTSRKKPSYKILKVATLFYNCKGKLVEPLSQNRNEKEVLLPPTQVQWKYHQEFVYKGEKKHIFIAKPVTVDTSEPTKPK